MRSKGSRRLPALSEAARRLEIERLTKKAPVGLFSSISRSKHWNVPKGRFSAEQGEPQASRIVEGRKAAGDRAFTERSPCGAFFGNKPIETLERPKGAFQCGARGSRLASSRTEGLSLVPVGVRAAPPRCAAASAGTAALARCARQRPGLRPGTRRRTEGALGSVLCPGGVRGARRPPASSPKATSRSEHRHVPKGRFSAEQGEPQASRIVGGRKAAGDRAFDEESPCGAFFVNKPIGTLERPKGAFQCGASSSIFRLYIRSSVITA